jgi:hypothetical protein
VSLTASGNACRLKNPNEPGQTGIPDGVEEGLSLSGYQQGKKKKGRKTPTLPALLYSRLTTLGLLLSIALPFARRVNSSISAFFMPKMALFS